MLVDIFKGIVHLSFMGTITFFIIISLKWIIGKNFSAKWHYLIWSLLIFRLVMPFSMPSNISIFNFIDQSSYLTNLSIIKISENTLDNNLNNNLKQKTINTPIKKIPLKNQPTKNIDENINKNINLEEKIWIIASYIWALGIIILLIFFSFFYFRLFKIVRKSVLNYGTEFKDILDKVKKQTGIGAKVIITDQFNTPFVFGIFEPSVIIPKKLLQNLSANDISNILIHEFMHLKWLDHIVNLLLTLIQSIHWFNPFVWFSFKKIRNDCELSCDERVLNTIESNQYKNYANTLLEIAEKQKNMQFGYSVLAFGESNLKRRIVDVMKFKKSSILAGILAPVVLLATSVLILTNPKEKVLEITSRVFPNTKVYTSKYGWSINYPDIWDDVSDSSIGKSSTNKMIKFYNYSLSKDEVDQYIDYEIIDVLKPYDSGTDEEKRDTINEPLKKSKNGDLLVYYFSHNNNYNDEKEVIKHTYIFFENTITSIEATFPDVSEREYKDIIDSFKIKKDSTAKKVKPDINLRFLAYKQGYFIAVNSGVGFDIKLPNSFDEKIKDYNIGNFLKSKNELSKKYGYDFKEYMGKDVHFLVSGMYKIDGSDGGASLCQLSLNDKLIGFWISTDTSESSDFDIIKQYS